MRDKGKKEYQTWLVKVNLDNVKINYDTVRDYGEHLLTCDDYDFQVIIKNEMCFYDKIEWSFVDWAEIRESVAEMI